MPNPPARRPYPAEYDIAIDFGECQPDFDFAATEAICMAKLYDARITLCYGGLTIKLDPGSSLDEARKQYGQARRG